MIKGYGLVMDGENKRTAWLLNADFCCRMAEQTTTPDMRTAWLTLAQRWLLLGNPMQVSDVQADIAVNDNRMNPRGLDTRAKR